MGILEKLGLRSVKSTAVDNLVDNLLNKVFFGQFLSNGQVTWLARNAATYVKDGYSSNEHVYSAIRVYLNKIKVAPFLLSEVKNTAKLGHYTNYRKSSDETVRLKALEHKQKSLTEIVTHELLDLLNNPNSWQTRSEFIESVFGFYKLLGETFIYGIRPGVDSINHKKFKELHVLPSHLVEVVYSGDYQNPVRGYNFSLGDRTVEIPASEVLHLGSWNPNYDQFGSQLRGFSGLDAGRKTLTRNAANQTAQTKAYQNGGSAYLLSSDSELRTLTPDQVDLINDAIKRKIQGADNFHNITATSGMVKAQKIGESPADLQLLDADKHDRSKIGMLFGIDPILLGDKGASSYNNQEQAYKSLVTNIILPDLCDFSEKLMTWLVPMYETDGTKLYLEFDSTIYSELAPDLKMLKEIYGSPLLTENEKRGVFNWDSSKLPEMDKIYIKVGFVPLEMAGDVAMVQSQPFGKEPQKDPKKE